MVFLAAIATGCATYGAIKELSKDASNGDYSELLWAPVLIPLVTLVDIGSFGTARFPEDASSTYAASQDDTNTDWAIAGALVSGATQAALTPGNSTSKVGAGLLASSQSLSSSTTNSSSTSSDYSSSEATTSTSTNPNCPANFGHLSSSLPPFSDPMLSNVRQQILATSMTQIVSGAKSQGISKSQTVSMAMRQADEFENTAMQNAKAVSGVSTYLTPKAIVMGVNNRSLSLSLPCSGTNSMVEAAECAVIQQVWGAMANREIAKLIPVCW